MIKTVDKNGDGKINYSEFRVSIFDWYLYDILAVYGLDSHSDHNKGPDYASYQKDPSKRLLILAKLYSRQPTL